MKFKILFLLFFVSYNPFLFSGWLDRKAEGWAWYEDLEKKEKPEEKQRILSPAEELSNAKKELEEKLAAAVLHPSEENVLNFMAEQKRLIEQSEAFSKIWTKILLKYPTMDGTITNYPVSQYGIQVRREIDKENKEQLIKLLAKEHGLFFFYEGKKKTSQAFSLVVKEFAKRYQWEVLAISMDNVFLEGFSNNKLENGMTKTLNINTFPSLFVINPNTNETVPIAFGLSTLDQIENNIVMQFQEAMEEQ